MVRVDLGGRRCRGVVRLYFERSACHARDAALVIGPCIEDHHGPRVLARGVCVRGRRAGVGGNLRWLLRAIARLGIRAVFLRLLHAARTNTGTLAECMVMDMECLQGR